MKYAFALIISLVLVSCYKGQHVDTIIHNAQIHTMDDQSTVYEAMAIKDGKIVELGAERQILNKYSADEEIDAQGRDVYPGFTDAHAHVLSLAEQRLSVDLVGCKSMAQLLARTELFQQKHKRKIIVGRGWDQSLWGTKSLPDNAELNALFPTTPVCLYRIDGHALLANDAMLKLAGVNAETQVEGGMIELKDGTPSGILVDNAMELVTKTLPGFSDEELMTVLSEIEQELLMYGITGIHEAGIDFEDIALFRKMMDKNGWSVNVYAMLMPSEANMDFARKNGIYTYKSLSIRSFKVMGDGALGSRGALLKRPYTDRHDHSGVLTTPHEEMKRIAAFCLETGYQMNTHAIGDSTNHLLLNLYAKAYERNPDHRWRIEHAQVVDPTDFHLFSDYGVFPSVQPTHAVSDQRWAEERLGTERMKGAYAYRTLLQTHGMLALGTDFPVESMDPFLTIHAAVQRKNGDDFPTGGFYPKEAITLEECLRGMTVWAAMAAFQETSLGRLEKGMDATFAIFEKPIASTGAYAPNFSLYTFIKGKKVYSAE